ncbi:MAG TPA: hypothetical protein VF681_01835 [Abditibacteriaceae bacterium]|jgi:hypothetical protein
MTPRRFALHVLFFLTPILIVLGCFEAALWHIGESVPVAKVQRIQKEYPEVIWGRNFLGQPLQAYKWNGLLIRRPRIAAIGSSRVMQFRPQMLGTTSAPNLDFYNCGGLIQSLEDWENFVYLVPDTALPEVMFFGVDHWWLNPSVRYLAKDPLAFKHAIAQDDALDWHAHGAKFQSLIRGNALRRVLVPAFTGARPDRLGTLAILKGRGFRADGSQDYNYRPQPQWRYVDRATHVRERILQRNRGFEAGPMSPEHFARLERSLKTLQQRGVLVCVFAPPISSEARRLLIQSPIHRDLWNSYRRLLPELCKRINAPYCDAASVERFGLDDRSLLDGIHAAETSHLHILRAWLRDSRVRAALPGTRERVERLLRAPKTNFWFPDYTSTVDFERPPKAEGGRLR